METKIELKDKFIGFVDILGYSALTRAAEKGLGLTLDDLAAITAALGSEKDRQRIEKSGPHICPHAPRLQKHVDFQLAQAWDSVVVSTEISPAGAITLVSHCWTACFQLLIKGVMCRGYIKRGRVHHQGASVFGSGHIDTVERERQVSFYKRDAGERGTPFIEVDPEVVSYVEAQGDQCVKEMFGRMVVTHEGLTALFPIKRLGHSFMIGMPGYWFDATKELKNNDNMRSQIIDLKSKLRALTAGHGISVDRKSEHYIRALDEQLRRCDVTDEIIRKLS